MFYNKSYEVKQKTKKKDKYLYSLFSFTYLHYLRIKMTSSNAVSFTTATYENVSPPQKKKKQKSFRTTVIYYSETLP